MPKWKQPYALALVVSALLAAGSAFGQAGDGQPVTANPFVEVHIDEQNGCEVVDAKTSQPLKRPEPRLFCADFQVAETFKGDKLIEAAEKECVKFYEIALRMQNLFCSYDKDAEIFEEKSEVVAAAVNNEKQLPGVHAVAGENRKLAGINKKYIERMAVIGGEFRDQYGRYLGALGKLSGPASTDFGREATCRGLPKGTNLDISGRSPGYLRLLLESSAAHVGAVTYRSIWTTMRANFDRLKASKEKAEANDKFNRPTVLAIPTHFEESMKKDSNAQGKEPISPGESATYGLVQYTTNKVVEDFANSARGKALGVPVKAAPIVASLLTLALQIYQNKQIMYLEYGAALLGFFKKTQPLSITASFLIGFYRNHRLYETEYFAFSHEQLKKNVNMTAAELVVAWGEKTKSQACVDSGKMEAACDQERARGIQAYSGSNCARGGFDSPHAKVKRSP